MLVSVFIVLFVVALLGIRTVPQQQIAIIETFGKFTRTSDAGLTWIIPGIQQVSSYVSLKINKFDAEVQIKTSDDAFVNLPVAIMLKVDPAQVYTAHYKLNNPGTQIPSWVLNALRSDAAGLSLQDLYSDKSKLIGGIREQLTSKLASFGFILEDVLIDQPMVAPEMEQSFNHVIASKRKREAAAFEAEANKLLITGNAQAEADAQILRAKGLAEARRIMTASIADSVKIAGEQQISSDQVMTLLLETNRFDTIRSVGASGNLVIMDSKSDPNITIPSHK